MVQISKQICLCVFLFLCYVSFAQQDTTFNQIDQLGQKQGYWKKFYKNGRVAYRGYFKDDKPRGLFERFHENGVIKAKLIHSPCGDSTQAIFYNTEGRLLAKGAYYKNQKDGKWEYFTPDGRLVLLESFKSGIKDGKFTSYYPTGEVFEEVNWQNDQKHGPTIQYYTNGAFKSSIVFSNGLENGIVKTFYVGGKTRLEGFYKDGLKHGKWTIFSPSGDSLSVTNYINGYAENQDELVLQESKELQKLIDNIGKIQEPTVEDFLRGGIGR